MKTFVQDGKVVTRTAPSGGCTSGVGVLFGDTFGVATHDAAEGEDCEILRQGVVEIAKTSALEITQDDRLYWDDTNKVVNKTATNQKEVGIANKDAANPSATVEMILVPTVRQDNSEGV